MSISPVFDKAGRLTNVVGVQREITARRAAEESLRQAEARYRNFVESSRATAESSAGTETILPVEDEKLVRDLSREMLETCGYTVIEAENGA